jgi:DNA polymerase
MLRTETPISKLRGRLLDWPPDGGEFACKLLPTYHPAFLLRNPAMKKPVWEDMQVVMKELGLKSK